MGDEIIDMLYLVSEYYVLEFFLGRTLSLWFFKLTSLNKLYDYKNCYKKFMQHQARLHMVECVPHNINCVQESRTMRRQEEYPHKKIF